MRELTIYRHKKNTTSYNMDKIVKVFKVSELEGLVCTEQKISIFLKDGKTIDFKEEDEFIYLIGGSL